MRLAVIFAVAVAGLLLVGAQEDDEKPKTLKQAKAEFATADKKLNAAWAETKKALSTRAFEELQKDQREWLDYRDRRAKEALLFDLRIEVEGTEETYPDYWEWLAELTKTRIEILRGWRGVGDGESWGGRYIDGYGGRLEIVEAGGGFEFAIDVVRGPTYHTGSIGGKAAVNGDRARFTDGSADPEQGEAWLTFVKKGKWLEVIGTNTGYYHGARAYFGGRYVRVVVLTAKEKAELRKRARAGVLKK